MKIALIQCPPWDVEKPPLGLAYLSASLRKNRHEVFPFDLNVELFSKYLSGKYRNYFNVEPWKNKKEFEKIPIPSFFWRDCVDRIISTKSKIVGFSVQDSSFLSSTLLAKEIKKKDHEKIIVFGGPDCYPKKAREILESGTVDIVVSGEGEKTIVELAGCIEKNKSFDDIQGIYFKKGGKIIHTKDRELIKDLDKLPFPDFSGLPLEMYKNHSLPILMSRGCPNRCLFCDNWTMWGQFRRRSAKNILKEIKFQIKRYKGFFEKGNIFFEANDLLINADLQRLSELCDFLIKEELNIKWGGFAMIRKDMDKKILRKMRKAGCIYLNFGIESGSDNVLKDMKKTFRIQDAEKILELTRQSGICVITNWIVGFPTETREDFRKTINFILRNKRNIDFIAPANILVIPGTIEDNFRKFGIIPRRSLLYRILNYNKPLHIHWSRKGNTYAVRKNRKLILDTIAFKNNLMPCSNAKQNKVAINPRDFLAEIHLLSKPLSITEDKYFDLEVGVRNIGNRTWHYSKIPKEFLDIKVKGIINLSVELFNKNKFLILRNFGRAFLDRTLEPGQEAIIETRLKAPKAGSYYLKLDMMRELLGRFSEVNSKPLWLPIEVRNR